MLWDYGKREDMSSRSWGGFLLQHGCHSVCWTPVTIVLVVLADYFHLKHTHECFLAYVADHSFGTALAHMPYPEHNSSLDQVQSVFQWVSQPPRTLFLWTSSNTIEPVSTTASGEFLYHVSCSHDLASDCHTWQQVYPPPAACSSWPDMIQHSGISSQQQSAFLSNKVRILVLGGYGESSKHLIFSLSTLHQPWDDGHFLHVSLLYPLL